MDIPRRLLVHRSGLGQRQGERYRALNNSEPDAVGDTASTRPILYLKVISQSLILCPGMFQELLKSEKPTKGNNQSKAGITEHYLLKAIRAMAAGIGNLGMTGLTLGKLVSVAIHLTNLPFGNVLPV